MPIDVLFGNSWVHEDLENGVSPADIEAKWIASLEDFRKKRERYLLYS